MSDSAVRLSDTCCQAVGESAVSAVRLSGAVRRCPGVAVRLSETRAQIRDSEALGALDSSEAHERRVSSEPVGLNSFMVYLC